MRRVLLDTSAFSAFMEGHEAIVDSLRRAESIVLNPIVLGELEAGFRLGSRPEENRARLGRFLSSARVRIVGVDEETALRYGWIYESLRRGGTPIPTNDIWIAATAMQYGLHLITTDDHFEDVEQVVVSRFER